MTHFSIGTRGSPLALWQAHEVQRLLSHSLGIEAEKIPLAIIRTSGDAIQDRALAEAGFLRGPRIVGGTGVHDAAGHVGQYSGAPSIAASDPDEPVVHVDRRVAVAGYEADLLPQAQRGRVVGGAGERVSRCSGEGASQILALQELRAELLHYPRHGVLRARRLYAGHSLHDRVRLEERALDRDDHLGAVRERRVLPVRRAVRLLDLVSVPEAVLPRDARDLPGPQLRVPQALHFDNGMARPLLDDRRDGAGADDLLRELERLY